MRAVAGRLDFEFERQQWTLEFDFAAIAFFERVADVSVNKVFRDLVLRVPMVSHMVWLMQAGLQKHHPGSTAEDAQAMLNDPAVQAALDLSLKAAMPDADPDEPGNAPAAIPGAATKTPSGAGTTSSLARSKRASRSPSSGRRARERSG